MENEWGKMKGTAYVFCPIHLHHFSPCIYIFFCLKIVLQKGLDNLGLIPRHGQKRSWACFLYQFIGSRKILSYSQIERKEKLIIKKHECSLNF